MYIRYINDHDLFSAGGKKIQSVGDWLEGLGLPQYENTLVANGFDDMDFVVSWSGSR